jgi:hypothetical protein
LQKREAALAGVPHLGQERDNALPQEPQNFAPSGFSAWQLVQRIAASGYDLRPGVSVSNESRGANSNTCSQG